MKKLAKNPILVIAIVIALSMLSFDPGEAKEKRLVLGTMNWAPYYAEHLPGGGPVSQISKEAFRQVGYDVEIRFLPWKRALDMSKRGQTDVLMGAYFNEERAHFLMYSENILNVEIVLIARNGKSIAFTSLSDLRGYSVGVLSGATISKEFDEATLFEKVVTNSLEQSVKMLLADRVDLVVGSRLHLLDLLNGNFPDWPDRLEFLSPALKVHGLYNGISKQNPDNETIVKDFNRGLKEIKENGTYQRIIDRFGMREPH